MRTRCSKYLISSPYNQECVALVHSGKNSIVVAALQAVTKYKVECGKSVCPFRVFYSLERLLEYVSGIKFTHTVTKEERVTMHIDTLITTFYIRPFTVDFSDWGDCGNTFFNWVNTNIVNIDGLREIFGVVKVAINGVPYTPGEYKLERLLNLRTGKHVYHLYKRQRVSTLVKKIVTVED